MEILATSSSLLVARRVAGDESRMPRHEQWSFHLNGVRILVTQKNILAWRPCGNKQEVAVVNAANEELLGAVGDDEDYGDLSSIGPDTRQCDCCEPVSLSVKPGDDFGGGGVDAALHHAAGPELRRLCAALPEIRSGVRCPTGQARITAGAGLDAGHVIHAVAPVFPAYCPEEAERLLRQAFLSALQLAKESSLRAVAIPALGCGLFGCPLEAGARLSMEACREFSLSEGSEQLEVHFLLYKASELKAWLAAARAVAVPEQGRQDIAGQPMLVPKADV